MTATSPLPAAITRPSDPSAPVEFTSYHGQDEASAFLLTLGVRRAPKTLQKQRVTGGGPPFMRICNRIVYELESLRAWALAQRSPLVTSTSELPAKPP